MPVFEVRIEEASFVGVTKGTKNTKIGSVHSATHSRSSASRQVQKPNRPAAALAGAVETRAETKNKETTTGKVLTEATDKELVKRVQKGDLAAFDMLFARYQSKIISLISRYVRDSEEVQDVAQEAFIKAYRALPRFRGDSAF